MTRSKKNIIEKDKTEKYQKGDTAFLEKKESMEINISAHTYMLEWGKGNIISSLPFALGDSIFSNQDMKTIGQTFNEFRKRSIQTYTQKYKNQWQR